MGNPKLTHTGSQPLTSTTKSIRQCGQVISGHWGILEAKDYSAIHVQALYSGTILRLIGNDQMWNARPQQLMELKARRHTLMSSKATSIQPFLWLSFHLKIYYNANEKIFSNSTSNVQISHNSLSTCYYFIDFKKTLLHRFITKMPCFPDRQ